MQRKKEGQRKRRNMGMKEGNMAISKEGRKKGLEIVLNSKCSIHHKQIWTKEGEEAAKLWRRIFGCRRL
jgi:hypothetical protein